MRTIRKTQHDYCLSSASADTALEELARVVTAEHRAENTLKRAKSEVGLSDYYVGAWAGWYHHQDYKRRNLLASYVLQNDSETRRHNRQEYKKKTETSYNFLLTNVRRLVTYYLRTD